MDLLVRHRALHGDIYVISVKENWPLRMKERTKAEIGRG